MREVVIIGADVRRRRLNSLFEVGQAVNVDPQLHDLLRLCSAVLDHAHPRVVTCKLQRAASSPLGGDMYANSTFQGPTHTDQQQSHRRDVKGSP